MTGDQTRMDDDFGGLETLLTERALWEESLWIDPNPDLEQRIVATIAAERRVVVPFAAPLQRRHSPWPGRLVAALIGAAAAAAIVVAARPSTNSGEAQRADVVVAMLGTELAPTVVGAAELTVERSGVRVYLTVPGLARRDGDQFYEGWLKNCAGTKLVPIGTFHELDDAAGWAGVALAEYPILTITREVAAAPKDAAQGSSGEVVVSGKLAECPAG